jgi:hypothetical protein
MEASSIYVLISVVVIALIILLVFLSRPKKQKLSPLPVIAFALVLAGIFFGDQPKLGYSLIGAGVVLFIVDMGKKPKQQETQEVQ